MTREERAQAFHAAIREAEQRYGIRVVAALAGEELGPVLQLRADLKFVDIDGWTPPKATEDAS